MSQLDRARLDRAQLEHLARLARLELEPDEIPRWLTQLDDVLALFEALAELERSPADADDDDRVESCPLRTDEVQPPPEREGLLAAAPRRDAEGRLLVPPVLRSRSR